MSFLRSVFPGSGASAEPSQLVLRVLVFILVLFLSAFYLFLDFGGLKVAEGMDQAQIAREIARGNGFVTKSIRPVALHQINESKDGEDEWVGLAGFQDTYHAPLNPLLNSFALWAFKSKWEFEKDAQVYYLDRVIAVVSVLLFLSAVGATYLLTARIFDARIAGATAVLLLLSELFWSYAQSGLPQMLMLFLFTFALYFLFKGVENASAEKSPVLWVALCGGFLGILALSNWLAIWIFFGAFVFTAFYFRPRGVTAFVLLGVFLIVTVPWGVRNWMISGMPLGAGFYSVYNGLGGVTDSVVMRNFNPDSYPLPSDGLPMKLTLGSLQQLNGLYGYLGSIVVAPLFFLSLLHPFRRREIAGFRWAILSMWVPAVMGMSVYGLTKGRLDPHQLHLIFVPMMTAYGLAFLAVLWTRLGLASQVPALRHLHFIIVIALSAAPLVLQLPNKIRVGLQVRGGFPNYPPYLPASIARLQGWTDENEVIVSDMPWAVAWYADRLSLWLPATREQFDSLRSYSKARGNLVAGIHLTPITINGRLSREIIQGEYADWARLILRGELFRYRADVLEADFPYRLPKMMVGTQSMFYSDSRRWEKEEQEDKEDKEGEN